MDRLDLGGLLVARLCHDLAGPVGSLGNGAELLAEEEDAEVRAQFTQLMAEAGAQAARRLVFFRLAFGVSIDRPMPAEEARAALRGWLDPGCALDWRLGGDLPRIEGRLALIMGLIAGEGLRDGGVVRLDRAPAGLVAEAVGGGIRLGEDTAHALAGEAAPPSPKIAPALLAAALAGQTGRRFEIEHAATRLRLALA